MPTAKPTAATPPTRQDVKAVLDYLLARTINLAQAQAQTFQAWGD